jgi:hypothetical protein
MGLTHLAQEATLPASGGLPCGRRGISFGVVILAIHRPAALSRW